MYITCLFITYDLTIMKHSSMIMSARPGHLY